jgi:hypothetical protein
MTEEWTVERKLAEGDDAGRELYAMFVELLDRCGSYTVHPAKSTITFKGSRRGFAGAHPKHGRLVGYLDLQRLLTGDPRIVSGQPYTKRLFVHHFRVTEPTQLDDTFARWVQEAYAVGNGEHLGSR